MQKNMKKLTGILLVLAMAVISLPINPARSYAKAMVLHGNVPYRIVTKGNKVLDVPDGTYENGEIIQLYSIFPGNDHQIYYFDLAEDGRSFYIRAAHSGKILEVGGFSTTPGDTVNQWERNDAVAFQRWELYLTDEPGWFRLRNVGSGLFLNVKGANYENRNVLIQYQDDGTDACKFAFLPVETPDQQVTQRQAFITGATVSAMNLPDPDFGVQTNFSSGSKVHVIAQCGSWYQVAEGGGFVPDEFVSFQQEEKKKEIFRGYVNAKFNLEVRTGPDDSYPILRVLMNREPVYCTSVSGAYAELTTGGWIKIRHIAITELPAAIPLDEVYVTAGNPDWIVFGHVNTSSLEVRKGPGEIYPVKRYLQDQEPLYCSSLTGKWGELTTGGYIDLSAVTLSEVRGEISFDGYGDIATAVRLIAYAQIGNGGRTYQSYCGLSSSQNWCVAYASYVARKASLAVTGDEGRVQKFTSTTAAANWFMKNGGYYGLTDWKYGAIQGKKDSSNTSLIPRPGMLLFVETNGAVSDGPDHTGIIVEVYQDGSFKTSEGNTGTVTVCEKLYHKSGSTWKREGSNYVIVHGFAMPPYE